MNRIENPDDLEKMRSSILESSSSQHPRILVCGGSGCAASGAAELIGALDEELEKKGLKNQVQVKKTGCHGFCEQGPVVVIKPENIFYGQVKAEDAERVVEETVQKKQLVKELLYKDPATGKEIIYEGEIPYYQHQCQVLLQHNSSIDPRNIEDYLAVGGYQALKKALTEMSPREVLEEVKASNLRGRGGAGFPAGIKWEACREASGDTKYVICNADEGDPGCFQDASLVEGNPHLVLEGMLLGAYAVGSREGYVYVRYEYPRAVEHFSTALEQARDYGLLGENILNMGFDFEVTIKRGGGAFVCGESSALIASLEGSIGEPRDKYIRNTESGLWGKPTVLNNVKTWASVPYIVDRGSGWFTSIGTEESPGTMIFSLTGKVKHTGLAEVPMGLPLRKLVYEVGGGIRGDKALKAVQTGGPSGGCVPEHKMDLPLDYESLTQVGSMLGSGGLIVMDEDTCMVDVARYFLTFTQEESCGKCIPCREGGKQLLEVLNRITQGEGREEDLDLILELSQVMQKGALCNLGKQAPNPVLTTLHYFKEEYLSHIREQKCPAGMCRALLRYYIAEDQCNGCDRCVTVCPTDAILGEKNELHYIDEEKCNRCGACVEVCRPEAVLWE